MYIFSYLHMHNFDACALIIEENSFDQKWLPAINIGGQFKYDANIHSINNKLGGPLTRIGYRRDAGEDFTLTMTKTFPKVFGRPLIASAGIRESQAAQTSLLGFSIKWSTTFEGNIGIFGPLANSEVKNPFWMQFKNEF